ncbi:MAG TPA: FAD-dependent oxidoreductase [Thermoanaerobaculia bacterium]|nr:FAD-dependent oxidoreductase [Thermoanaerobaculia bacterium]
MPDESGEGCRGMDRRRFLKGSLGLTAAASLSGVASAFAADGAAGSGSSFRRRPRLRVAVVGAGAFGGWTALELARRGRRRGVEVVLVDAWGPGNSRSSSGGETRVIRSIYGGDALYTDWVTRALERWREAGREWGEDLYRRTGVLWMFRGDDGYARSSLPLLAERGLTFEDLGLTAASRRFPQVAFDGVRTVLYESEGGYLAARRSCRRVASAVAAAGGELRTAHARPGAIVGGEMASLHLSDGSTLAADRYVFACGPWLGRLFPEVIGAGVTPTRQDVYFFGVPPGEARFGDDRFPVWVDWGDRLFYGVPTAFGRGFKVADDTRGEPVDPTSLERTVSADGLARARRLLDQRFPPLAGAPLVEARVCQYENSPDGHLILDRHPQAANAWIAGGGSGHGYKLGPAVGEHVAQLVLGETESLPRFSIGRLAESGDGSRTPPEAPDAATPERSRRVDPTAALGDNRSPRSTPYRPWR